MKTLLLENDNWFWTGLEDFCKSFDADFVTIKTDVNDHDIRDDLRFTAILSQPFVERCIIASSFESKMYLPYIKDGEIWQVEHYLMLIDAAIRVREKLNYKPLHFEINFHGVDFIKEIKEENWGWDFSADFKRVIRQNPDNLIVNVYNEYKFVKRIVEGDFY